MNAKQLMNKTVRIRDQQFLIYTHSNALTALRIVLAPIIVAGIVYEQWAISFVLFVIAALTDVLDGYLARLFNESSSLGAFLDPIADKILLFSCFAALAAGHSPSFAIPWWFVGLVLTRETILLSGGVYCFYRRPEISLEPTFWGKLTTFFQIIFIVWIFVCYFCSWAPAKTYYLLLGLLALCSLFSCLHYVVRAVSRGQNSLKK